MENSLDAGATRIVIEIEGAGSALIRVSDNGSGMDAADLRLCIRRFATSKIGSLDDLETAASFGFRGEALPSIAAVSHLEIVTAVPGSTEGRRLKLVGGEPTTQDTVGAPPGTTVNRRSVHSRTVNAAVEQAYRQLIPAGRYPVFVVFVDLPGHRVDVNVHPRKLDIRFDDDHQIFTVVSNAVRAALRSVPGAPGAGTVPIPAGTPLALAEFTAFSPAPEPVDVARTGRLPAMRLLGQLHGTYLVAQGESGLVLIDQHAAHERILYERLLHTRHRSAAAGQVLVDPVPMTLAPDEAAVLAAHREIFEQIGFDLEPFGDRTVLIRKVPGIAANRSAESLLRDLLAEVAGGAQVSSSQTLLEQLTTATACHTAIRAGDRLAPEQMAALLSDLAQTDDPFTCFHGRPTLVAIPLSSLERWFLRK